MNKVKEFIKKRKGLKRVAMTMLLTLVLANMSGLFVYASPGWGKNAFDFVKDIAWWGALGVIAVFAVKYIAKRAWVQAGGFVLLGAIVLVIVDDPTRLKNLGVTIWNVVFR